jgi:hypothetical protein
MRGLRDRFAAICVGFFLIVTILGTAMEALLRIIN